MTDTTDTTTDTTTDGWTLTPDELAATRERIARINMRARRRSLHGYLTVTATPRTRTTQNDAGFDIEELVYDVRITGDAPSLNGWTLLGAAEFDEHAGLIIRTVPGVDTVDRTSITRGHCDHCGYRRNRSTTYIVRNNETGEQKQVGSGCVYDYLGWRGRPVFLTEDEVRDTVERDGMSGIRSFSLLTVLAASWAVITTSGGYVSLKSSGRATYSEVLHLLNPSSSSDREAAREFAPKIDAARAEAEKIRDFLLSDDFRGDDEYHRNLRNIAGADFVNPGCLALLISSPVAWMRHQEIQLRKNDLAATRNEHVGAVGDKIRVEVQVKKVSLARNGTTFIYHLRDAEGRAFKWFASSPTLGTDPSEKVFILRGTVKGHGVWNGCKETILTRCSRIVSEMDAHATVTGDIAEVTLTGHFYGKPTTYRGRVVRDREAGKFIPSYTDPGCGPLDARSSLRAAIKELADSRAIDLVTVTVERTKKRK